MKLYKVNAQTMLNGFLVGIGTYDAERLGKSVDKIEAYCKEQKALPLEKRDIPPYFEIIDTDSKAETPEQKMEQNTNKYVSMQKKDLLELCKQRGIDEAKGNMSNADLVKLLLDYDANHVDNDDNKFGFKSAEEFLALDTEQQVEYLDEIFCTPDGIDEDSEEAVEYMNALEEAVAIYGGLSIEQDTVDKIKEIVDYLNGEDDE